MLLRQIVFVDAIAAVDTAVTAGVAISHGAVTPFPAYTMKRQTAVTAHFLSEQLLLLAFSKNVLLLN